MHAEMEEGRFDRRRFLQGGLGAAAMGVLQPGGLFGAERTERSRERPNILLIVSDEMAPSYLGCYGGEALTPNLDSLARDGVRFRQAYCVSAVCAPSRFSILTGLYPGHCRHPAFLDSQPVNRPYLITWNTGMHTNMPCIARALGRAGYYTGFVGKWGVGFADSHSDWDIPTFERGDDPDGPEVNARLRRHQRIAAERVKRTGGFDYAASVMPGNVSNPIPELRHHQFEWITRGALDFLDSAAGREVPFFLYAATTACHGPNHARDLDADPRYTLGGKREDPFTCHPPRSTIRERLREAGLAVDHEHVGMLFLDDHVDALLRKLRETGLRENTLVLFVPDHNVEPGKATCYQRGVHVPMLMRWPGHVPEGATASARVQFVDILPTLCDAAGVAPPGGDGLSFLPVATGTGGLARESLYFEIGSARAVLAGDYKYIAFRYRPQALERMRAGEFDVALDWMEGQRQSHSQIAMCHFPGYFDPDQLYDLSADPYEQRNLAADPGHADTLQRMKGLLRRKLEAFEHPYSLEMPAFMRSDRYRRLVQRRLAPGTSPVGWWPEDFEWPPAE